MKLISLLLGFLFGASPLVFAQQEDLRNDEDFFQSRVPFYQRWMDQSAIGEVLSIQELQVKENNLFLFLRFNYSNLDSMMNAWEALRQKFEREMPVSLEEQLYYKLVNIMDIPDGIGYVGIYDSYDLTVPALFMRGIYFENGEVQIRVENPMSELRELSIGLSEINKSSVRTRSFISPGQYSGEMKHPSPPNARFKQKIYSEILAFAREKYANKTCENDGANILVKQRFQTLRFTVTDLCNEVIVDGDANWLCRWLALFGRDCNSTKREALFFQFIVNNRNDGNGFDLTFILDGQVGDHSYEKGKRGYLPMEMDFDDSLKKYADQFQKELKAFLVAKH